MLRVRKSQQDVSPADARLAALTKENQRLRELLAERTSDGAVASGYLHKYRSHAESSLWANTWEVRFVVLKGLRLSYYRKEQDVQYPPRGQIDLQESYIEPEGLKRRKFWTFNIRDATGASLIRLSTESQADYGRWLDALEQAGCERRGEDDGTPLSSLQRVSGSSHVSSPTASGLSDSDTSSHHNLARPSPDKLPAVGEEVTSGDRQRGRGYTSDQSDVVRHASMRQRQGAGKGGQREAMRGSSLVHTQCRYSFLSSERIDFANQNGLLTLLFLILITTNARLILENILKYGLRFNPITFVRSALTPSGNLPLLLCWPALAAFVLAAFGIEALGVKCLRLEQKAAAANRKREVGYSESKRRSQRQAQVTENLLLLLNFLNTTAVLVVPSLVMHYTNSEPLPGFVLSMAMTVLWLKLVSYAHVNWDYRQARRKGLIRPGERGSHEIPEAIDAEPLQYPENITLGNLGYFIVAPTLCYQPVYPRNTRFRVKWLLRRLVVLCFALGMMLFIIEQYIEPIVENSIGPLRTMDWVRMSERVLKLSLPTLYFWLSMFYVLFHLWLNIAAELTTFADREFYKEWWNATTIGEYWRLWNMPVHKWMLRHVYFPCIRHGINKFYAGIIVFFVSAVFHELVVGVPLHMLRMWAFWGIMGQVPLIWVTEVLKKKVGNDHLGNMIFWISFCFVGQPIAIILYFHDYMKQRGLL